MPEPFETFLGVDQTGATDLKGRAKPLPVAIVQKEGRKWKLIFAESKKRLEIPTLTEADYKVFIQSHHLQKTKTPPALILDSVFGLPKSCWPKKKSLFQLLQSAATFQHNGKSLGRDTAEAFFHQFLSDSQKASFPQRNCELQSGANSIFRTRPFQRNIGCGTFRIWSELGQARQKWFHIWAFERTTIDSQKPWIFEAYPSLFWKKILGSPTRKSEALIPFLKSQKANGLQVNSKDLHLLKTDPDLADSVVLAVGAWKLQEQGLLWDLPSNKVLLKNEGWILGLEERPREN